MKKDYTHITLVLDRSGSMEAITSDTIGAVNKFLKEQKEQPGEATLTLVLFDHEYMSVHEFKNIKDVPWLDSSTYFTRGTTALMDAIGRTINQVGSTLAGKKEEERPESVLFAIVTDGLENASREFSKIQIVNMIDHQTKKYNWDFVYLGANQDAINVATSYNIPKGNSRVFYATSTGMGLVGSGMACATSNYRNANLETKKLLKGKFFSDNISFEENKDLVTNVN